MLCVQGRAIAAGCTNGWLTIVLCRPGCRRCGILVNLRASLLSLCLSRSRSLFGPLFWPSMFVCKLPFSSFRYPYAPLAPASSVPRGRPGLRRGGERVGGGVGGHPQGERVLPHGRGVQREGGGGLRRRLCQGVAQGMYAFTRCPSSLWSRPPLLYRCMSPDSTPPGPTVKARLNPQRVDRHDSNTERLWNFFRG